MKSIELVLVDDHHLFREGLANILNLEEEIEIIGEAYDGQSLIELLETIQPDIVLMDIDMPDMSGIEATRLVKEKFDGVKVLIFSGYGSSKNIFEAIKAGASGFILKNAIKEDLIYAIKVLDSGNTYYSKGVSDKLSQHLSEMNPKKLSEEVSLSNREMDILRLIADGLTNHQIADKLFISTHTVVTHRRNLLQKINAKNTAELIKFASIKGYLE